jgi:tetratricopeptide (TPR) repeat protein
MPSETERAEALHARGTDAFDAGDRRVARRHFEAALALWRRTLGTDHPHVAAALNNLGVVHSALNDFPRARRCHQEALAIRRRTLGEADPAVAESLNNLGVVCRALGEAEAAEECHAEAVELWRRTRGEAHPDLALGLTNLGHALRERGAHAAARDCHERALAVRNAVFGSGHPAVAESLSHLGVIASETGMAAAARQLHERALAIRIAALGPQHRQVAESRNNLGVALRDLGEAEAARTAFEAALAIAPDLASAHRNFARLLVAQGDMAAAQAHRARALRAQSLFIEPAPQARLRLLILQGSEAGNVALDALLPVGTTRLHWFVEAAAPGEERRLPPYDLAFNAIGEADLLPELAGLLRGLSARVLNPPGRVARTRRDLLPALLGDIPDLVVPEVQRVAGAGRAVMSPPYLLRPAGAHGGAGLHRVDGTEADAGVMAGAGVYYRTRFHEFRSDDGWYRKYRMIFVDRVPYPYHLAISRDWLVHYFSADMLAEPWKIEEEKRFLADPAAALGARALAAVAAVGRRLDLDYAGIDFAVLPDGRALLFEANATMLVHTEDVGGPLAHKNAFVLYITDAFSAMLRRTELTHLGGEFTAMGSDYAPASRSVTSSAIGDQREKT